jgi:hypothetical protein
MFTCAVVLYNCSDDAYNEKYKDPTKVSEVSVEKLMTGTFLRCRDFSMAKYFRYFAYDNLFLGKFSQTFGFYNVAGMYTPGFIPYAEEGHQKFYSALTDFKQLEKLYNEMSDAQKKENEAYYWAAKVHILDYFVAMLDLYGDLPWTDACKITLNGGNITDASVRFEKAPDLYKMVLTETKTASERFASMSKPTLFAVQDFINEGDFMKWRLYANSVRLRVAMRVSSNGQLTAEGRAALKEIIENPSKYPVVESNEQNIQIWNRGSGELNEEGGGGGFDWASCRLASGAVLDRMLSKGSYKEGKDGSGKWVAGVDDPRLPLLYCLATADGSIIKKDSIVPTVYRGTDPEMDRSLQTTLSSGAGFSHIRENGFFWKNKKWDHQLFSAAELWFIKAEAFQQGWAQGDAKDAFKRAIKESVEFYYYYQSNRSQVETSDAKSRYYYVINPDKPTEAEIDAFAEARWEKKIDGTSYAGGKLEAILTQKWINFGILFVREAWNDLRRTGYPSGLVFPNDPGATIPDVPCRWRYPEKERNYNRYYSEVAEQDTYYNKLFWAK